MPMQAEKKLKPDVFAKECPSRALLAKIANKWSLLIIDALENDRRRNGELLRMIEGISQKMLTQCLRELEEMNLVTRHDMDTVPPHVEYELSPLGHSLRGQICGLDRWIEDHMAEVMAGVRF